MRPLGGESLGAHRAVADSDGTSELDEVTSRDGRELREEGDQVVDTVVNTRVLGAARLDRREDEHRTVSASTTIRSKLADQISVKRQLRLLTLRHPESEKSQWRRLRVNICQCQSKSH